MVHLAEGWLRELQHADHPPVLVLPQRRHQHVGEPRDGDRHLLAVVGAHALPALVHEVYVLTDSLVELHTHTSADNYIVAGALDGGTQVISFILNLAVFGAVGEGHLFPEWWGNDLSASFLNLDKTRKLIARVPQNIPPIGVRRRRRTVE